MMSFYCTKSTARCRRTGLSLTLWSILAGSGGLAGAAGEPVRARNGMVASSEARASQVGVEILKSGGNAVDAAVATALALAVTHPTAGNIGGGGFMLVRMADGRTTTIDYRETAPSAAHKSMYLDGKGELIAEASWVGYKAAGVPGTVAGLAKALEQFGTKKWADLLEPARKLAADGFEVTPELAKDLRGAEVLAKFPESKRIFLKDGEYFAQGDLLRQPELAATLQRMQEHGPREFYEGKTAQLIADDMKSNGGLITLEDLRNYTVKERAPLKGTYRGYQIVTMPPPSSGGVALIEMLNALEFFDLGGVGPDSPDAAHIMIEIMRRAFADRAEFLGDPDFVTVPVKGLTSKAYGKKVAYAIDQLKATPSAEVRHGDPAPFEAEQTTHFSIVDAAGNVVSNTFTLNGDYGCGAVVRGAGFLLNNEMDDFTSKPGAPNAYGLLQGERNTIEPGRRPLSSMTPTIVLIDDKFFFTVGSPGGPTIISTVLQVILNVLEHKMELHQAVAKPRLHHQWQPDVVRHEGRLLSKLLRDSLTAKGHRLIENSQARFMGDVQAIAIDPVTGERIGVSDPRRRGRAVGY